MELQRSRQAYISPRDLSRVPAFRLGPIAVEPATRSLAGAGRRITVEPRVMQVLVALGLDPGQVLSRDDLIALCWDGVIVGDNAINRVISLLRQALAEVAGDAVRLETITKVGFRIVVDGAAVERKPPPAARRDRPLARRPALIFGAALIVAAGAGGYFALRQPQTDPRALELAREADLLMKSGLPGSTRQATRNLERAVQIDPDFADGWGYLALMYRHALGGFSSGERANFPRMVDSAAARALSLRPGQPDARLALALKRPFFRRWSAAEADLRAVLRDHPDHWYANAQLALLLMDVGRAREALLFRERVNAIDPKIPVSWSFHALNLLMANRLHEADATLDRAFAVWPNHPALWFTRFRVLLETRRPAEAAAFVRTPRSLPDDFPPAIAAFAASVADALASGSMSARERAVERVLAGMDAPEAADRAYLLALLGAPERALEALAAYLRGGRIGPFTWPAPDEHAMRPTATLFYPSLLALAPMPAYQALLHEAGLEDYWHRSGSQPDFRRV